MHTLHFLPESAWSKRHEMEEALDSVFPLMVASSNNDYIHDEEDTFFSHSKAQHHFDNNWHLLSYRHFY